MGTFAHGFAQATHDLRQPCRVFDIADNVEKCLHTAAALEHVLNDQIIIVLAHKFSERVFKPFAIRRDDAFHRCIEYTIRCEIGTNAIYNSNGDFAGARIGREFGAHDRFANAAWTENVQQPMACASFDQRGKFRDFRFTTDDEWFWFRHNRLLLSYARWDSDALPNQ